MSPQVRLSLGHALEGAVANICISGINFYFRNEKTFMAEYFHHRFNKYVTMWTDKFNNELEFRELLRDNSCKLKMPFLIMFLNTANDYLICSKNSKICQWNGTIIKQIHVAPFRPAERTVS